MSKIIFKADFLGVVIIQVPFEKPNTEVYIFDRATLSGFAINEFARKEDLNKKKNVLLLISYLRSWFD